MRVQRLPLLPLVPIGGLLLVQLTDVVLGVLGVSLFTCWGRENSGVLEARANFVLAFSW